MGTDGCMLGVTEGKLEGLALKLGARDGSGEVDGRLERDGNGEGAFEGISDGRALAVGDGDGQTLLDGDEEGTAELKSRPFMAPLLDCAAASFSM